MALISKSQQQRTSATDAEIRAKHKSEYSKDISRVPIHPISQLQGPFEESIVEATESTGSERLVGLDAQSRRRDLLESIEYKRLCGRKWLQRPGERYHPIWKLIAQISFGIHLLVKRLAKSDFEVLKILQNHVDELDGFLGRSTEDFLLIQVDVRTRIQYLNLPLQNLVVFDEMLQDRNFRLTMIDYNLKIEHAIERFAAAIEDALKDVQKGKEAIGVLWRYLKQSAEEYGPLSSNLLAIYKAMLANTEGWNVAFSNLRRQGVALQSALSQLCLAITELQRRVGIASRKEAVSLTRTATAPPRDRSIRERLFKKRASTILPGLSSSEKPLPSDPFLTNVIDARPEAPLSKQVECLRVTRKSAPNLRALHGSQSYEGHIAISDGAECGNLVAHGSIPTTLVPRIQRNLSRRLSKAVPTSKKFKGENAGIKGSRPATAPSRGLRSRSISLEQLKGFWRLKKDQQYEQQDIVGPPPIPLPTRPYTAQGSAKRETMLNQFLHHFKSDRVIDAWEDTIQKESAVRHPSQRRKDEPYSKFRAISTTPGTSAELQTKLFESDLERSMSWFQEHPSQNTYSLKPRRDVAPRIHVVSVHMTLGEDEGCCVNNTHDNDITKTDTQSTVTALPSVPPP
ncbi:hypothetical protein F9C07_1210113 [Aspergillus flavus]|uniref:Uncharacterized protein n=2 Tax=Aspergillus flavus TaxID=5059 RepID=A0A7U2MDS2_ASPFN|nr:hypothetical protein BDV35DRAFT_45157 [Aspergillus flavus]KAF7632019.1 hypothetical protein AFLA_012863 [Aspergillus flavus NRRL3357]KOC14963.1 hypothetical protein AFLA70_481g000630 [Aspergillus flavus AF70]QRD81887.1 hypothetical protein F9C07_1210113 [Aspergillus flavus]UDD55368.1 hypothetical protein AFCA_002997 [Aspergillus flavus]